LIDLVLASWVSSVVISVSMSLRMVAMAVCSGSGGQLKSMFSILDAFRLGTLMLRCTTPVDGFKFIKDELGICFRSNLCEE